MDFPIVDLMDQEGGRQKLFDLKAVTDEFLRILLGANGTTELVT